MRARRRAQGGAATLEFALVYVSLIVPVTFALVFTSQMIWIWHSMNEWTRDGARYAATHCWQDAGANVVGYMRNHVPVNIDQDQFATGQADLSIQFFSRDPDSGALVDYSCDSSCSPSCVPDVVTVSVSNYEFRRFLSYLGIAPLAMPNFSTTVAIEGAGCDPATSACEP